MDSGFLSRTFVPRTTNMFFAKVAKINDQSSKITMLGEYVDRLEVEMKKIEAFKRELPLVMLLLSDVIVAMKEELASCKRLNKLPVLEEFIPLKKNCNNNGVDREYCEERDVLITKGDKMDWMSSVQLWNSDHNNKKEEGADGTPMDRMTKKGTMGSAFIACKMAKDQSKQEVSDHLSLRMPEVKNLLGQGSDLNNCNDNRRSNSSSGHEHQCVRKPRRCWSPDMQQRFIAAMEQLGGPEVATPKQIRELMQVEGLTNDQVKSHLQKYRLRLQKVRLNGRDESSKRKRNARSRSPEGPFNLQVFSGMDGDEAYEVDGDHDGKSESIQ